MEYDGNDAKLMWDRKSIAVTSFNILSKVWIEDRGLGIWKTRIEAKEVKIKTKNVNKLIIDVMF